MSGLTFCNGGSASNFLSKPRTAAVYDGNILPVTLLSFSNCLELLSNLKKSALERLGRVGEVKGGEYMLLWPEGSTRIKPTFVTAS